jgi:hypothetical protein
LMLKIKKGGEAEWNPARRRMINPCSSVMCVCVCVCIYIYIYIYIYNIKHPHHFDSGAATLIATGPTAFHTCAIASGGGLQCWGLNSHGQLGIGSTVQQNSPTSVALGSGAPRAQEEGRFEGVPSTCAWVPLRHTLPGGVSRWGSWPKAPPPLPPSLSF